MNSTAPTRLCDTTCPEGKQPLGLYRTYFDEGEEKIKKTLHNNYFHSFMKIKFYYLCTQCEINDFSN